MSLWDATLLLLPHVLSHESFLLFWSCWKLSDYLGKRTWSPWALNQGIRLVILHIGSTNWIEPRANTSGDPKTRDLCIVGNSVVLFLVGCSNKALEHPFPSPPFGLKIPQVYEKLGCTEIWSSFELLCPWNKSLYNVASQKRDDTPLAVGEWVIPLFWVESRGSQSKNSLSL